MRKKKPYKVNEKSLKLLRKWLRTYKNATFKATKVKQHAKDRLSFISVGTTYYGEAAFDKHPWTKEKCMTFGFGVDNRMWTSPVLSAKKMPGKKVNAWLVKTYNSLYQVEVKEE